MTPPPSGPRRDGEAQAGGERATPRPLGRAGRRGGGPRLTSAAALPRSLRAQIYEFSAPLLGSGTREAPLAGDTVTMESLAKGKVAMIQNVATI